MDSTTSLSGKNIIICGAGIAGLSSAWHLARNGAKVTVLDKNSYDIKGYHPDAGNDAASADHNKIFRASYGDRFEYQKLAYIARDVWKQWNSDIANSSPNALPQGISRSDVLYYECGYVRLPRYPSDPLSVSEQSGLGNLANENIPLRLQNYIIDNPYDRQRAIENGWNRPGHLIPFNKWNGTGVLDTTAGFVEAYKACLWIFHLCKKAGVKFIMGDPSGQVTKLIRENSRIIGVETADKVKHFADLTIVAAGPWTPQLVDECSTNLEATAGSVLTIKLPPKSERPDLWEKYSQENFPVWQWNSDYGSPVGSVFGFPRNEDGVIKFIYRGTKYTNYQTGPSGKRVSTPLTGQTNPSEKNIPLLSLNIVKAFVQKYLPDICEFGINWTRMCWYTDSIDNHFLVDFVPKTDKTLFVVSGGSGHMFKFTPILGEEVAKIIQGKETILKCQWQWRDRKPSDIANGLEQNELGPRSLCNVVMATPRDWKFGEKDKVLSKNEVFGKEASVKSKL